jgi:hypothetical protein
MESISQRLDLSGYPTKAQEIQKNDDNISPSFRQGPEKGNLL